MPAGVNVATAYLQLRTDNRELKRDMSQMRRTIPNETEKLGKSAGGGFGRGFVSGAKSILRNGIRGLVGAAGLGAIAVKFASDAQEINSKFAAVFKHLESDAERFSVGFADKIGRSTAGIKKQMSEFQDTFVPMGFAREKASELSKTLVGLTADLGSFNNMSDAEVQQRLIGGLIGSHENLLKFGVVIKQVTLDQELMNMGIKGGAKAATEQQKVLARLNLIMRGTTDAQGDAERTAGSFANQMKALKGTAADVAVELGQVLLPAATELVGGLKRILSFVKQQKEAWGGWLTEAISVTRDISVGLLGIEEAAAGAMDGVANVFEATWDLIRGSAEVFFNDLTRGFFNMTDQWGDKLAHIQAWAIDVAGLGDFKPLKEKIIQFKDPETGKMITAKAGGRAPGSDKGKSGGDLFLEEKRKITQRNIKVRRGEAAADRARLNELAEERARRKGQLSAGPVTDKDKKDALRRSGFASQETVAANLMKAFSDFKAIFQPPEEKKKKEKSGPRARRESIEGLGQSIQDALLNKKQEKREMEKVNKLKEIAKSGKETAESIAKVAESLASSVAKSFGLAPGND